MSKKVSVVNLKQPCTACIITCNLVKEILRKLQKTHGDFELEIIELSHINEAPSVEGLEVEKFPAIIVDGEQITAGSLPQKAMLISYIYEEGTCNEKD